MSTPEDGRNAAAEPPQYAQQQYPPQQQYAARAPQYQQPQYPPQGGQPVYYSALPPTNTLSIIAFVLAFVVSLGAVICGHIALSQIKRTGERGHGFAVAALVLGYIGCAAGVIAIAVWVMFAAFALSLGLATSQ